MPLSTQKRSSHSLTFSPVNPQFFLSHLFNIQWSHKDCYPRLCHPLEAKACSVAGPEPSLLFATSGVFSGTAECQPDPAPHPPPQLPLPY